MASVLPRLALPEGCGVKLRKCFCLAWAIGEMLGASVGASLVVIERSLNSMFRLSRGPTSDRLRDE